MGEGKVSLKREDESLFLNEISPFSESKPITNFGRTNRPRPRPTTPPARKVYHTPATAKPQPVLSNNNHYTNLSGVVVHSPAHASSAPAGASALPASAKYL